VSIVITTSNCNITSLIFVPRARVLDSRIAASIMAASKTCIPRNINNGEKARMSRNLGRQNLRAQQSTGHAQLNDEIADIKSRIGSSAQETKDLKEKLKGLSDKKKEMGQSPRHSQAPSNRHNFPIPKIRPPSLILKNDSASLLSVNRDIDFSTRESPPVVVPANSPYDDSDDISQIHSLISAPNGNTQSPSHPPDVSLAHSPYDGSDTSQLQLESLINVPTGKKQSHEIETFDMNIDLPLDMNTGSASTNLDEYVHPFEFPPFDLDMFNAALEDGPIPQPSAEELQAHRFLRGLLRK
jgi:hypothetical protein